MNEYYPRYPARLLGRDGRVVKNTLLVNALVTVVILPSKDSSTAPRVFVFSGIYDVDINGVDGDGTGKIYKEATHEYLEVD